MTPAPTLAEVDQLISQITTIRDKWHGNPGYARNLDIELYALRMLAEVLVSKTASRLLADHMRQPYDGKDINE